jgi:regulation of enolase protein 1 (concanavalin A-like superfamily)
MQWLNEPPHWQVTDDQITMTAAPQTDFWRVTRHGYIVDNGHFFYEQVEGDFAVSVQFSADYTGLYDQAGLMLRVDEQTWVKCGIEYVEEQAVACAAVTREFSDWSVVPLPEIPQTIWFKIARIGTAIEVSYALDGETYIMIREAYFTDAPTIQVGVMCAAPRGDGFEARFTDFNIS